jgi:hypothetical protein
MSGSCSVTAEAVFLPATVQSYDYVSPLTPLLFQLRMKLCLLRRLEILTGLGPRDWKRASKANLVQTVAQSAHFQGAAIIIPR